MTDYHQYVGQDLIIVQELLEDVDNGEPYEHGFAPPWNYVGNVLHITSFDAIGEFFYFTDQDGKKDDVLMPYDIDNGFVAPFQPFHDAEDETVDSDMIISLL